ncbi:MAG: response regulator [Sphingomonas sp.]|nr:response regulator [Sphingomonas sp.]MBY0283055.1 response regulator [Sphingomonas sp.]
MLFGRKKRVVERLLIVEDEPLIAFDNERFLGDEGYVVVGTFDCVADAVALIASGASIDLVLSDISLADGSGLDVARAASAAGLHVLFVTGDCPAAAHGLGLGWLAKPYALRNLTQAITIIDQLVQGETPKRLPEGLTLFKREA